MSKYINTLLVAGITPFANGGVYIDRQVTDLGNRAVFPAAVANADQIQIGIVPGGCVLIPHLCALRVPKLDANGAPTGKFKIGTETTIDALALEQNGNAAVSLTAEDFVLAGVIGDPVNDVPIFLTASAAVATLGTGKVILDLAIRNWRPEVDAA